MATKENLMGLGVPHFVAGKLGHTPVLVTAASSSIGAARVVGQEEYDLYINATNGGNGLVLKSPASVDGPLLGDEFWVTNILGASVALYIRNALIYVNGVSVSGSLGLSVGAGQTCIAKPLSASTWAVIGSVLSN